MLAYEHSIYAVKGVKTTIPMYDYEGENLPWYKKPIIPISISSIITFLTVYEAIRSPPQAEDTIGILTVVGIPTAVTFLSQTFYRYFSHEHIL